MSCLAVNSMDLDIKVSELQFLGTTVSFRYRLKESIQSIRDA